MCRRLVLLALVIGLCAGLAGADAENQPKDEKTIFEGRSLKDWLADLDDAYPLNRDEAIEVLAQAGPAAKAALPKLLPLLKSGNAGLRVRSALAVWRISPAESKAVIAALAAGLQEADLTSKRLALDELVRMGEAAAPVAAAVIDLHDDPDVLVRDKATRALSAMGTAARAGVLAALQSKDARTRRNAIGLLVADGATVLLEKEQMVGIAGHLKDSDLQVRVNAARLLWNADQTDKDVVDALTAGIQSTNLVLRNQVLNQLANSVKRPRTLTPLLEVGLKLPDEWPRLQSARMHYQIEKKADSVVPIIHESLKSTSPAYWGLAIQAAGEVGPEAKVVLPRLLEMMRLTNFYFFTQARTTLTQLGEVSVDPMLTLLKDTTGNPTGENSPPEVAIAVLGKLGKPAAKAVVPLLDDKAVLIRYRAVRVVGSLGIDAKDSAPRLAQLIVEQNSQVREAAVAALGALGENASSAVEPLLKHARSTDSVHRNAALRALTLVGPTAEDGVPVALDALKDENTALKLAGFNLMIRCDPKNKALLPALRELLRASATRSQALQAAAKMEHQAEKAVPYIAELLKDPSDYNRRIAVETLGQFGPKAALAVPEILQQLNRPDPSLNSAVFTALRSIPADKNETPHPWVEPIKEYLKTSRTYAVQTALTLLGELGSKAADAGPVVGDILRDGTRDMYVRNAAALTLVQIDPALVKKSYLTDVRGLMSATPDNFQAARVLLTVDPADKGALARLEAGLRGSTITRANAIASMGHLGPRMKKYAPVVREALKDSYYFGRGQAALALWRITGESRDSLSTLQDMLTDRTQSYIRSTAASLLREMGPAARPALPALRVALNDTDPFVRSTARTAITHIERE